MWLGVMNFKTLLQRVATSLEISLRPVRRAIVWRVDLTTISASSAVFLQENISDCPESEVLRCVEEAIAVWPRRCVLKVATMRGIPNPVGQLPSIPT